MPEHLKGFSFLKKEIIPRRDLANAKALDAVKVNRFHLTGENKQPLKDWFTKSGVYIPETEEIRYNPLIPKSYYAPTAAHEGTHAILFQKPFLERYGLIEDTPLSDFNTGSERISRVKGPRRTVPTYKPLYDPYTGTKVNGAKFDPITGESLQDGWIRMDFDPNTGLAPEHVQQWAKTLKFDLANELRVPLDALRAEILSRAFPIRKLRGANLTTTQDATSPLEKDASVSEMLYRVHEANGNALDNELTSAIKGLSELLIMDLLKTNGYTLNYKGNILLNDLLYRKSGMGKSLRESINDIKKALLMRKVGGKLNYTKFYK